MSPTTTPASGKDPFKLHPFDLGRAYEKLFERWGPQGWWPADTQTEIIAGALLAQATNWKNVAQAVANLKSRRLLEDSSDSLHALLELPLPELAEAIRPSGYFRQKSKRLHRLMGFLADNLGSPPWKIPGSQVMLWRERLLELNGLGPETVDSILLYGFDLPCFVVDAYTRRLLLRHGMITDQTSYEEIRFMFEDALPRRSEIYNEYHALIVRLGKEHCRRSARCTDCPLFA
ncbi:endonuclease [candidate division TA06 bacterium B3_TA06]|uniref:Endonuclease n=1 Tax=candidate division TA06 bacterium B3_TA06 TaxID=2012487 RepID=A0A532V936_UNCT6|nr:MAG: endonuclease [candidate division TA06 bacterium B3_TA06]